MSYSVEFVEPVLHYLANVDGLNDADRAAIIDGVIDELSHDADRFHALQPLAHESLCFRYDFLYPTMHALYRLDFVVDARYLEMGVVRVVYLESTTEPIR